MGKKKIEPTDAMVDAVESARELVALDARAIMRAALNHPDAAGLFADETPADARPWEPLNEGDSLRVGDEVRRDYCGTTTTAVVGSVDDDGAPWTAERCSIGLPGVGTWYIRRPAQELPTEDGAVIVPAEGREFIEAEVNGQTYITREAVVCQTDFGPANVLQGAWRRVDDGARSEGQMARHCITPGTWKVDDQ